MPNQENMFKDADSIDSLNAGEPLSDDAYKRILQTSDQENRFKDADTIEGLILQAVGAGSVCWENVADAGDFLSGRAKKIAEEATIRLYEILQETIEDARKNVEEILDRFLNENPYG